MSPLYRRIGRYEIRREIGGGGMSDVFEAEDERDGKMVALKVPHRDPDIRRAEHDGALLQQHLAERDSRVAQVYETGEDDGVSFVAMEYVAGQDLAERLVLGPLEPKESLRIALELSDLLATAHACTPAVAGRQRRGIVHGDLKPRNIRLEPNGRVRVVDFGIAKALSETRRLTHNEFGSMSYSSPERVESGQVDAQTDLWAVAVVLYEMLTGAPPFHAETPRQLEQLLLGRTRPASLPDACPRPLDAVLRKAFAPRLQDRYAGAAELKTDLERVAAGAPTVAEQEWERSLEAVTSGVAADPRASNGDSTPGTLVAHNGHPEEATRRGAVAGEVTGRGAVADEATRRTPAESTPTQRTAGAGEATRRTSAFAATAAGNGAAAPPDAPTIRTAAAGARAGRGPKLVRIAKRAGIALAILLVVNEGFVVRAAGDLTSRLPSYGRADAGRVWQQYQNLRGRSLLRVGAWSLGWPLKNWHVAAADELTDDYLSDTPTIRERGWQQAAALLRRAAVIAPMDSKVRARLRYCEGQLARIDGEALLERGQAAPARARFNEARRAFEEAARLRGHWPDPHLGLARVEAVAFADVDQTEESLQQAERAGYRLGDRETALMADAYRLRAERMMAAVPGLPDDPRYLERVRSDCDRALDLYDQVPAYAQVNRSIRKVQALLARLEPHDPFSSQPGIDGRSLQESASGDTSGLVNP